MDESAGEMTAFRDILRSPGAWKQLINVFFASFGFIALRFLLSPIRIKVLTTLLTKEQYGTLGVIMAMIAFILQVSSLGSLEFMLRRIPGRDDVYQYGRFRVILVVFGGLAALVAAAGAGWLSVHPPRKLALGPAEIAACALLLVLTVHLSQYVHFLLGLSKYALSRIAQLLSSDTWFVVLAPLLWIGGGLRTGHVLWLWVGWLVLTIAVMQPGVRMSRVWSVHPPRGEALREILAFGVPLMPMILGEWLVRTQDRFVLLGVLDAAAVGNYTLCVNTATVGILVGGAVLDILLTEFFKRVNRAGGGDLAALATRPDLRAGFTAMVRYAAIIGLPFAAAMAWTGRPVLRVLSDPKYLDAAPVLVWLAPYPLFYLLTVVFGRTLLAASRSRELGLASLAAAGLNIAGNLLLVPSMKENGAALSITASYGLLALYLGVRVGAWRWIDRRRLGPVRLTLLFAASAGACVLAERHLAAAGALVVLGAAGAGILAAVVALGLLRRDDLGLALGTFAKDPALSAQGSNERP